MRTDRWDIEACGEIHGHLCPEVCRIVTPNEEYQYFLRARIILRSVSRLLSSSRNRDQTYDDPCHSTVVRKTWLFNAERSDCFEPGLRGNVRTSAFCCGIASGMILGLRSRCVAIGLRAEVSPTLQRSSILKQSQAFSDRHQVSGITLNTTFIEKK